MPDTVTTTPSKQFQDADGLSHLRIRNWEKFQHFTDRRPPWIKLYRDILDDYEWHQLDDSAARTLVMLWLLASEDKTQTGLLPCPKTIAFRLRLTEKELSLRLTRLSHWLIQDDITLISDRKQIVPPETETETYREETETETDKKVSKDISIISPISRLSKEKQERGLPMEEWMEDFWRTYPRKIGKKDAFKILERIIKVGNVSRETLMAGVERYRDYAKTKDIKYIKHPSVWLNKGCWDDEFAPAEYVNGDSMREKTSKERLSDALQRLGSGSFSETLDIGLPKLTSD